MSKIRALVELRGNDKGYNCCESHKTLNERKQMEVKYKNEGIKVTKKEKEK